MLSSLISAIVFLGFTNAKDYNLNSEFHSVSQTNISSSFVIAADANQNSFIDYLSPFNYQALATVMLMMDCSGVSISYTDNKVCGNDNTELQPILIGNGIAHIYESTGSIAFKSGAPGTILPDESIPGGPYDVVYVDLDGCRDTIEISITEIEAFAGFDFQLCDKSSAISIGMQGNTPLSGQIGTWTSTFLDGSPGNGVFTNPNNPGSQFIGQANEEYILTWTIVDPICGSVSDQITAKFGLGASQFYAWVNAPGYSCGATSIQLQGVGSFVASGEWTILSGDGNGHFNIASLSTKSLPKAIFTGTIGETYDLRWQLSDSGCTSEFHTSVTFAPTLIVEAGDDQELCDVSETILDATPHSSYNGMWTITSGDGLGSFSDATDPNSVFFGTLGETYTLEWTLKLSFSAWTNCATGSDQVEIQFGITPEAYAGFDQSLCTDNETLLLADTPSIGDGKWSIIASTDPNADSNYFQWEDEPVTDFQGVLGHSYTLRWTVTNPSGCTDFDDVIIEMGTAPGNSAHAGLDQIDVSCTYAGVTLDGWKSPSSTGTWAIDSGTGGLIYDVNDPNSLFTGEAGESYDLVWTVTESGCTGDQDTVTISYGSDGEAANAGDNIQICDGTASVNLNADPIVNANQGTWTVLTGTNGNITSIHDPQSNFNGDSGETYSIEWAVEQNGCVSRDTVLVTFETITSNAGLVGIAGPDQDDCITTVTLDGDIPPVGTTGQWTVVSGQTTGFSFVDDALYNTEFTGTAGETYTLRWTISDDILCPKQDDVEIALLTPPVIDAGSDVDAACLTSHILSITLSGSASVTWDVVHGPGTIPSPNSTTPTVFNLQPGTNEIRATQQLGNCVSVDYVKIFVDSVGPNFTTPLVDTLYRSINCEADTSSSKRRPNTPISSNCGGITTYEDLIFDQCGGSFNISRVWTIEDTPGNITRDTQKIVVIDDIAPTFTVPANITVYRQNMCTVDTTIWDTGSPTDILDNCDSNPVASYSDTFSALTCAGNITINRRWVVKDVCGNVSPPAIQLITLNDNTPPTFTIPRDTVIILDSSCSESAALAGLPSATGEDDNCTVTQTATYTDSLTYLCGSNYTITRTWELVDDCNNYSHQIQTIEVKDTSRANFVAPPDTTIYIANMCVFDTTTVSTLLPTQVMSYCSNTNGIPDPTATTPTHTLGHNTGFSQGGNNFAIPWAMETDSDVNTAQTIFELGDNDNGLEVIITNGELQVYHSLSAGNAVSVLPSIPVSPDTDYVFILYRNAVGDWFIFIDKGTSFAILTSNHRIRGLNHPGPVWNNGAIGIGSRVNGSAYSDQVITSPFNGNTSFTAISLFISNELTAYEKAGFITQDYSDLVSKGCGDELSIRRVWRFEDGCGIVTVDTQYIEVIDTISPVFTAPAQDTFWYTDNCLLDTIPDLSLVVVPSDNCSSSSNTITYSDVRIITPRSAIRTWRVTDDCGNYREADQTLIFLDTIPPVLTCPSDQTASTDSNCDYIIPDYTPLVSAFTDLDNCPDSELTFSQIPVAGTVLDAGIHEIAVIATDVFDNADTCYFNLDLDYSISTVKVLCGDSYTAQTTFGQGNRTNSYSCIPFNAPGQEVYYQVDVPPGNFVMNVIINNVVDPNDQDIEILWMGNSCPINNCATYTTYNIASQSFANGTNKERFIATGPDTYYIVLDSKIDGIASYDIEFECFDSAIELDRSDDCVTDTDNDGVITTINGETLMAVDPCQTVEVCEEIYIKNRFAGEWLDSLQMILGDCYTNIRAITPTGPNSGFHNAGEWTNIYDAASNTIFWEFDDDAGNGRGDGFDTTYGCDSSSAHIYTFCFTADLAVDCAADSLLNITIVVADDEIDGLGGDTGPGIDIAVLDDFIIRDTIEIEEGSAIFFNCTQDTLHVRSPYSSLNYTWSTLDGNILTRDDSTAIIVDEEGTYVVSSDGLACISSDTIVLSQDSTPPSFTTPGDTTMARFAGCLVDTTTAGAGIAMDVIDNSGMPLWATYSDVIVHTCEGDMTITRTWTVTDACGNDSSDVQIITVIDTLAPTFNTPSNITVYFDENCALDTTTNNTLLPTGLGDNCDGTLVALYQDDIISTTRIERIWSLEDDCGNIKRDTQIISLSDTLAPILTCPSQQVVTADAATCQYVVQDFRPLVGYTDNCDSGLSITQSPAPGTSLEAGLWPITMSITDDWGNTGTCTFDLLILADNSFEPIVCGASFNGLSTSGATSFYNNVGCSSPDTYGGDKVFQLSVPNGNYLLEVSMNNVSDVTEDKVYLMWMSKDCPISGCPLKRYTYDVSDGDFDGIGTNTATIAAPGPGTYYLVIDSRNNGIDNFDISFECIRTGLLFDDTNCAGDPDSDGLEVWVNDAQDYELENCQQNVNICHEVWVKNTTSIEWLDSVVISLGSGYENIRPSSTNPSSYDHFVEENSRFYASSGEWREAFNNSNNTVVFDYNHRSCGGCGDGNTSNFSCGQQTPNGPNKIFHYTFCFQADISSDADHDDELLMSIKIIDDGVGAGLLTAISGDVKMSDKITLTPFSVDAGLDDEICSGDSIQLTGSGSGNITWIQNGSVSDVNDLNTWVTPTTDTEYILEGTNGSGCVKRDTVSITVRPSPISGITGDPIFNCLEDTLSVTSIASGVSYQWTTIDGAILSFDQNPSIRIGQEGKYFLTSTSLNNCVTVDSFSTTDDSIDPTFVLPRDTTLYRDGTCLNDTSTILMNVPTGMMDNYFGTTTTTHVDAIANGCSGTYTIERRWIVADDCGNAAVQSQYIHVVDTVGPSFTWPSDVNLVSDHLCMADTSINNTGSAITFLNDNCDQTPVPMGYYDVITNVCARGGYTVVRNWQVADDCGNITTRQQYINVIDNTPPTFTIPDSDTLFIDEFCFVDTTTAALGIPVDEFDNCSIEVYESIDLSGFTADASFNHGDGQAFSDESLTIPFVYTSGSDVNSYQTLFELGGNSLGLHVRVYDAKLEVIHGISNGSENIVISTSISSSSEYANILHRTAAGDWYLFMNIGSNVDALSKAHMFTGGSSTGNLWGSGNIGIGQVHGNSKGTGGLFSGSAPSQPLQIYGGDNLDQYINATASTNTSTYHDIGNSDCSGGSFYFGRVWAFSDACGNAVRDTQHIWVLDTIKPTFTRPIDLTLYLDASCNVNSAPSGLAGDVTDEADNCTPAGSLNAIHNDIATTGDCTYNCTITRVWELTDDCDNVTRDTQTIMILDTISPTFTAPADVDVYGTADCTLDTIADPQLITNLVNNCNDDADLEIAYVDNITPNCTGTFEIERIWTITDQNGNNTSQTQILSVIDTISPTFTVPMNVTLHLDANCFVDADTSIAVGTVRDELDGCSSNLDATFVNDTTFVCTEGSYTIERTWTLTDDCNNTTTKVQIITVLDTIKPTFSAPRDTVLFADANCAVNSMTASTGDVIDEADNCTTAPDATYVDAIAPVCTGEYIITRTWSLVDACDNAAADQVQLITVRDTIKPTFTRPIDVTLYVDASCNVNSTPSGLAGNVNDEDDNCSPAASLDAIHNDITITGDCTSNCVITRVWELEDDCGNITRDTQTIMILDTISPTFTAPVDVDVYGTADCTLDTIATPQLITGIVNNCNNIADLDITYTDNITPNCTGTFEIERVWTITDDNGNNTSQTQIISVIDTISPTFTVPMNVTLHLDANCFVDADTSIAVGTVRDELDGCSSNLDATFVNDTTFVCTEGSYSIERTWTLSDDCNNTTTKVQIITVLDTIKPTFSAPRDTVLFADANCDVNSTPASTGDVIDEADNCTTAPNATYVDAIAPVCTGEYIITRTWSLVDACDNAAADQVQLITVRDTIKPTFTRPIDITLYVDASCDVNSAPSGLAGNVNDEDDNCSPAASLDAIHNDITITGDCTSNCVITRVWELEDDCGNITRDTQTIMILDTISPTFTAPVDVDVYGTADCTLDTIATPQLITGIVNNCNNIADLDITYTDNITPNCTGTFEIERVWTITDDNGNNTSQTQIISVIDTISPTFTVPMNVTLHLDANCFVDADTSIAVGTVRDELDGCSSNLDATFVNDTTFVCTEGSYSIERTWTLSDDCNNTTTKVQIITVLDTIKPTFSAPRDTVLFADANCAVNSMPASTGDVIDEADNCTTAPNATYVDAIAPVCTGEYIITRTWSLVDACDNAAADQVQLITVRDTIKPTFTRPIDITLYVDASCDVNSAPSGLAGNVNDEDDNCSPAASLDAIHNDITITGDCTSNCVITRVWELEDDCGNITRDTQTIMILDTISPTFTAPVDVDVYGTADCTLDTIATPQLISGIVNNCNNIADLDITYTDNITPNCTGTFEIERVWTITDDNGNNTSQTQIISVIDTISPTFTVPMNVTLHLDANCFVDADTSIAVGTVRDELDGCSSNLDATFVNDTTFVCTEGSYSIERTWTLTDDCNNTTTKVQIITVLDTIKPTFSAPRDTVLFADANCAVNSMPASTGDVTDEADNCTTAPNATFSDTSNPVCTGEYIITRTWSLVDACGNAAADQVQLITVRDTIKPTFTRPIDITLYVDASCDVNSTPSGLAGDVNNEDDNCSPAASLDAIHNDIVAGDCSYNCEITRVWTLEDDCGNITRDTQTIMILDTISPTFMAPADVDVYGDIDCSLDTIADFAAVTATIVNNCNTTSDLDITYIDNITPDCTGTFEIERIWTITDQNGNSTSETQILSVIDTISPTFTVPGPIMLYLDDNCTVDADTLYTGSVIDELDGCSTNLDATFVNDTTLICTEGSYTIERTWTLTDDCNNTTTKVQIITVLDTIKPTFSAPRDTVLFADANCAVNSMPASTGDVTDEADNCTTAPNATFSDTSNPVCTGEYIITRTWSLVDACGNAAADQVQLITVRDIIKPTFTRPIDITLYVDASCDVNSAPSGLAGNVNDEDDNCSPAASLDAIHNDITITGDCTSNCVITRVWELEDDCGNITRDTQTIMILDTISPTFTAPVDVDVYGTADCTLDTIATPQLISGIVNNCNNIADLDITYTDNITPNCTGTFEIERVWTITDDNGNNTSQTQIISVIDTISPTFTVPMNVTLHLDANCFVDADTSIAVGTVRDELDGCSSNLDATFVNDTTFVCTEGSYSIERTWTLTDDCNNTTTKVQIITVLDTIKPTFSAPRDTVLFADANCDVNSTPASTGDVIDEADNCTTAPNATYVDAIAPVCTGEYIITRTWSLVDACDNAAADQVQLITVRDTIKPTFTRPIDITLYVDASCDVNSAPSGLAGNVNDEDDNCSPAASLDAIHNDITITGDCTSNCVITRVWELEDDCGNITRDTQTIMILDTISPTFTAPVDVDVYGTADCTLDTIATPQLISGIVNNCNNIADLDITYTDNITPNCTGTFEIERVWTITDDNGNNTSQTQIISVIDTISPTFTVPMNVTLHLDANCFVDADTSIAVGTVRDELDGCSSNLDATFVNDTTFVCTEGSYSIERTWTLTDDCNNTTTKVQIITVLDTIKPTFSAPRDTVLFADANCAVNSMPASTGDVTDEADNCTTAPNATFSDTSNPVCTGEYIITRTWSLVDACGNAAADQVQLITVRDTIKPTFTRPIDITLYVDASCDVNSTPSGLAGDVNNEDDNCSPAASLDAIHNDIVAGDCSYNCEITRVWTLEDDCGNITRDTQTIMILDTISPTFMAPADVDVYGDIDCSLDTIADFAAVTATIVNNCNTTSDLDITYIDNITPDCTGTFEIERIWTITDQNGNSTSETQILSVIDTISPTFTVPGPITLYLDDNCTVDADTLYTGSVIDELDGCSTNLDATFVNDTTLICTEGSYTIERTWTLSDDCNNTTTKVQIITVLDTIKPTFTAPRDTVLFADTNCDVNSMPISTGDVTDEADNCTTAPNATFSDTSNPVCTGEYIITRTWSLVDACGNAAADQVQLITVRDTIKPTFTRPIDITLYVDASCDVNSTPSGLAGDVNNEDDNCSPAASLDAIHNDIVAGDCSYNCEITRVWTLEDDCGNITRDTQTIMILDTISPTFMAPADVDVYGDIDCSLDTIADFAAVTATIVNNCNTTSDLDITYIDNITPDCTGTFEIERIWTITDQNGNSTSETQILSVIDTISPTFTVPGPITLYLDDNCTVDADTLYTGSVIDELDGCSTNLDATFVNDTTLICTEGSYTIERTWTLTDDCNNTTTKVQTITVLDTIKPTFTAPRDTVLFADANCFANNMPISTGDVNDEADNCTSTLDATYSDAVADVCSGEYVISRTWSLIDACGNIADAQVQTITVRDTITPTFDVPNAASIYLDEFNNLDSTTAALGTITNIFEGCTNNVSVSYRDSIVSIRSAQILDEVYRIWTIEDDCGNTDGYIQQITLIDTIAPAYVTPAIVEIDCEFNPPIDSIVFTDINDVVDVQMIEMIVDTPCIDKHNIVRTWTATDGVGNQSVVDQIYSVTSCNVAVSATISDESPCTGEFVHLNGALSHPIAAYTFYPQWFYRSSSTDPWTALIGGARENVIFPAYTFRSGEYKLVFSTDVNHIDSSDCQYESNVFTLNVHAEEPILSTTAVICNGETYAIGDSTFTQMGDYNVVFQNQHGCDSIVALHLDVLDIAMLPIDTLICRGDFYETATGTRHYNQGLIRDTLSTSTHGCDSILLVNIDIAPIHLIDTTAHICEGETFMFNGDALTVPGQYIETFESQYGCDSLVTLNLVVNQPQEHDLHVTICPGETYIFDALAITADSEFPRTFTGVNGCDSIVNFKLTVAQEIFEVVYDTTCYQEPYFFGSSVLVQSGVYRDTVPTADNCNNITELHLYMREPNVNAFDLRICAGEVHVFKNQTYDASTMLVDTLSSTSSCDSIVQVNLIVEARQSTIAPPQTICAGDSVQIGNNYVKTSGTYNIELANYRGCLDSTVTYNITVLEEISKEGNLVICASDSVFLDGAYRNVSDTYITTYSSSLTGCDSVITTNLVVEDDVELWTEDVNVCLGDPFDIIVDGADDLTWTNSNLLSCATCPNPSGLIDVTTTFTATAAGCAGKQESIDVTVNVFNEVQIEVLTKDTTLTWGESIVLDAFVTDPFTPITWFDQAGNELCTNCTRFEITPEQNGIYYAEANSNSGCTVRDEVVVNLKSACSEGEIIVPNFITPNADGLNDDIKIRHTAIRSISKMRIFNRWGQLVFQTDDVDNNRWTGLIDGQASNPGVYVYFLEYQCLNGEDVFQKGTITLMK